MKHLDNNELGDRLQLVMNFIFVYSNCIKNIDFNINDPIDILWSNPFKQI